MLVERWRRKTLEKSQLHFSHHEASGLDHWRCISSQIQSFDATIGTNSQILDRPPTCTARLQAANARSIDPKFIICFRLFTRRCQTCSSVMPSIRRPGWRLVYENMVITCNFYHPEIQACKLGPLPQVSSMSLEKAASCSPNGCQQVAILHYRRALQTLMKTGSR